MALMDTRNLIWVVLLGLFVCHSCGDADPKEQDKSALIVSEGSEAKDVKYDVKYVEKHDDYDPLAEPFIPTREWQEIKPGQGIPRGLHIRINFQTGKKEAKILEEENSEETKTPSITDLPIEEPGKLEKMKVAIEQAMKDMETGKADATVDQKPKEFQYWKEDGKEGMVNMDKKYFSAQDLKEALKKFKANRDDVQDQKVKEAAKANKYKSMDEIKQEFKNLKLQMQSDMEILQGLIKQYKNDTLGEEDHVKLLTDLEYYLHQIDNAKEFVDMGGLKLLAKDLNSTVAAIRSEACFVLGSAAQSNPRVQVQAVDGDLLRPLLRLLSMESSQKLKARALYALSSIIRNFPYAQQKFMKLGGITALSNLFNVKDSQVLPVKAITLVSDLLLEQKYTAEKAKPGDKMVEEKLRQYKQVPILETIVEQDWCSRIPSLLIEPEHDSREKVLAIMNTIMDSCKHQFKASLATLNKLRTEYVHLSEQEKVEEKEENGYFTMLLQTTDSVLSQIPINDEL